MAQPCPERSQSAFRTEPGTDETHGAHAYARRTIRHAFFPPHGPRNTPPTVQPAMPSSRRATLDTLLRPYSRLVFFPPRNPRHASPTVQPPCFLPAAQNTVFSVPFANRIVPAARPVGLFFARRCANPRHIFGLASPSPRTYMPVLSPAPPFVFPPRLRREHICPSSPHPPPFFARPPLPWAKTTPHPSTTENKTIIPLRSADTEQSALFRDFSDPMPLRRSQTFDLEKSFQEECGEELKFLRAHVIMET